MSIPKQTLAANIFYQIVKTYFDRSAENKRELTLQEQEDIGERAWTVADNIAQGAKNVGA